MRLIHSRFSSAIKKEANAMSAKIVSSVEELVKEASRLIFTILLKHTNKTEIAKNCMILGQKPSADLVKLWKKANSVKVCSHFLEPMRKFKTSKL